MGRYSVVRMTSEGEKREGAAMADTGKRRAGVHVRLSLPNGGSLDETDIALIETLQKCRSILGASKLLGLSYRKTWLMADALNRIFETKVIETFPGRRGRRRGGDGLWSAHRGSLPLDRTPVFPCRCGGSR